MGNPTNPQTFQSSWTQWGNGQTMAGAYKPATQINSNVGPLTIQFSDPTNAVVTMPDGTSPHHAVRVLRGTVAN